MQRIPTKSWAIKVENGKAWLAIAIFCAVVVGGSAFSSAAAASASIPLAAAAPEYISEGAQAPPVVSDFTSDATLPVIQTATPAIIPLSVAAEPGSDDQPADNEIDNALGVDLLLFDPTSSTNTTGHPPLTNGLLDNVPLFGASQPGGNGLSAKGFFLDSDNSATASPGAGQQALDQSLAYKSGTLSITTTVVSVGKTFLEPTALNRVLATDNAMNINPAKAISGMNGQQEQTATLSFGTEKSGVVSASVDQATNALSNKNTGNSSLGYKWGDVRSVLFAFLDTSQIDRITHMRTNTQSVTLAQTIDKLLQFTITHAVQQSSGSGSGPGNVVNEVEMAMNGKHSTSVDLKGQITHDSLGGYDRLFGVDAKRMAFATTLGFHLGDETRYADGGAAPYSVHTLGYSVDKQYKSVSYDSSWLETDDQSQPVGHQQTVVASSKLALTPLPNLSVLDLFTTNNGTDSKTIDTSFTIPSNSALAWAKLSAAVASNSSPSTPSSSTRKFSLDASLTRLKGLIRLASVSNLHLDVAQTDTNAWGTSPSSDYGAATAKMSGSLAAFIDSHWSYAYVARAPIADPSGAPGLITVPAARAFDLTLPYRAMSFTMFDHDQIPEANGIYRDIKQRRFELSGPLPGGIAGSAMFMQTTDETCAFLTQRREYGLILDGRPGFIPDVELGVTRQVETAIGSGTDTGMDYKLAYKFLPTGSPQAVTLSCSLATNSFDGATGSTDKMAATVHCDYSIRY